MRISDWSSDVCSSDLRAQSPEYPSQNWVLSDESRASQRTPFHGPSRAVPGKPVALRRRAAAPRSRPLPDRLVRTGGTARGAVRAVRLQSGGRAQPRDGARADARPHAAAMVAGNHRRRSEEHTSELQSLMRISYAVFCLKKKT